MAGATRTAGHMIDLHCHLLPDIDDGPPDLASSVAMARTALAAGTRTIVATPHVSWTYRNTPAEIRQRVTELCAALEREGVGLEVLAGAEVDASYLREVDDDSLEALRLGDGDAVLLECPLSRSALPIDAMVFALHRRGLRTVLAHPERSPTIRSQPGQLEDFVRAGVLTQVTTGSLLGQFGREAQRFTEWMFEEGLVHNVASDAHDTSRRPPKLREALSAAAASRLPGLSPNIDWLTHDVPRAILDGAPLPPAPGPTPSSRRGPLRRLTERMRRGA